MQIAKKWVRKVRKRKQSFQKEICNKRVFCFVCQDFKAQSYKKIQMCVRSFVNPSPVAKATHKMWRWNGSLIFVTSLPVCPWRRGRWRRPRGRRSVSRIYNPQARSHCSRNNFSEIKCFFSRRCFVVVAFKPSCHIPVIYVDCIAKHFQTTKCCLIWYTLCHVRDLD